MNIRRWVLKLITPFTRWVGKIELHQTRMPDTACWELETKLRNGDVILSRRMWALSNLGLPGFYKHATIFRNGYVIEAIGTGVQEVPLPKWLYTHDYVCVLRPTFCDSEVANEASARASLLIGAPYDFQFEPGIKAFYCSELVYHSYDKTMGGESPFKLRKTLGVFTIEPEDFIKATDKFTKVWEHR